MKTIKLTTVVMLLIIATSPLFGQDANTEKEAVLTVMKTYKGALQNLTTDGTFELFTENSEVFESGGVEGTYSHYIEHHLGPELGHFEKFEFTDYEINVKVDVPYAFTTETYIYTIVLNPDDKGNNRTIKKKGVATSILEKIDGKWKITKMHSSSRNVK
ncbi:MULTISPECIES: nuclear transport factor 2 family protein [Leeuwenhoekiella]|uniref:SnoaL-like domain-containing protein n=1 Tax=Leeuwenhoekiella palythoae TaxID=573501 RepID=A0A1M5ZRI3_9FLAO|nr:MULTISPECIES: nuclear transport factor 2 family protein [Leeuwenhoekiella]MBH13027.1 nuclear transport factor 2 family protein [Leeuwenhoekiella sp.]SHI26533.1 SnoaL-like domain-containing protein [Leeuwenhoekiella palythoae]|tara:strand:+ start:15725 stop:16201 length:477 start_codon:yes stop_codon:yes gene_type:complete